MTRSAATAPAAMQHQPLHGIVAVVCGSLRRQPLWPFPLPPSGMIVREMARQAPDLLSRNAAAVMPLAYTARMDEDSEVADLWKEVRGHLYHHSSGAGVIFPIL